MPHIDLPYTCCTSERAKKQAAINESDGAKRPPRPPKRAIVITHTTMTKTKEREKRVR